MRDDLEIAYEYMHLLKRKSDKYPKVSGESFKVLAFINHHKLDASITKIVHSRLFNHLSLSTIKRIVIELLSKRLITKEVSGVDSRVMILRSVKDAN